MDSLVDTGPPPPCPAPFNLAAHVLAAGRAVPDKPALELLHPDGAEVWTHADIARAVATARVGLHAAGLAEGDRLLMRIGNEPAFPIVFLAAIHTGIVPVPTSAALTAPEVAAIARDIRPAAIVAAPGVALPDAPGCPVLSAAALVPPHAPAPSEAWSDTAPTPVPGVPSAPAPDDISARVPAAPDVSVRAATGAPLPGDASARVSDPSDASAPSVPSARGTGHSDAPVPGDLDAAAPGDTSAPALGDTSAPISGGTHALALGDPQAPVPRTSNAPVLGDPDRPAFIVYTSGTSGQPRAVVHAHRSIWARRMMTEGWYGLRGDDRLLHAGAFNWTFTLGTGLLDPWAAGATALIPAPGTEATALPALLARHAATIFAAAPGLYRRVLRARLPPVPTLRHGLSAGEKLPPSLRAAWRTATGTDVHEAFGMSECSTFLSGSPARPAPDGASGYAQPGRRLALIGPDHAPVPRGTPGTIAVAATDPGLMLGYLDRADETRARFTPDGAWFLTGDEGVMDAGGAITHLGRRDDMMNAGGVRVSPLEVEAAFLAHPAIADAAAVERPVASGATVIALHYVADAALDDADLAAFAAARLARYKCPRIFVRETALPRGANNKLLRRALRTDGQATPEQEPTPDGQP